MVNLRQLKMQVEEANALGVENLVKKGVAITEDATTYQIMGAIGNIVGGTQYRKITYNDDDTLTLIAKDGTEHRMVCTYEDDKLTELTFDGRAIELHYKENDVLDYVDETELDLIRAPYKDLFLISVTANQAEVVDMQLVDIDIFTTFQTEV